MAHMLVRFITHYDGDDAEDDFWHLVTPIADGDQAFCSSEYFGFGESTAEYETKTVKRGGITCPECLSKLQSLKEIKL